MVLYRENRKKSNIFYEDSNEINIYKDFAVTFGGFTINSLEPNLQVLQVLTSYVEVVLESTQIAGALLDDLSIRKEIIQHLNVPNYVVTVHLSNHDAVSVTLKLKSNYSVISS